MFYVHARVLGEDEHALTTRSYLAAMATITEVPLRGVWTDAVPVLPALVDPEAPGVYELASRALGPVQGVVRLGAVSEVTGRGVEGPFTVALTWWTPGRLTRTLRARLDAFSEVWVPHAAHVADYPRASVVPIPFDCAAWLGWPERAPGYYAIGRWATGALEEALVECLARAGSDSEAAITLVGNDIPLTDPRFDGRVRLLADVPTTLAAARRIHLLAGSFYVGPASFHAEAAAALDGQAHGRDEVAALIAAKLAAAETVAIPEPEPVPAGAGPMLPILSFVIPVRDVDHEVLDATLASLLPHLSPGDEVVLSAQGSSDVSYLRQLALSRRLTLVEDEYFGVWTIARARNAGFNALKQVVTLAPRYVVALDADLRVPDGWVAAARALVQKQCAMETAIFVPLAVEHGEGESRVRRASGAALLPRGLVETARGWDESYVGYGSEDLDLIHRLRTDLGARLVLLSPDDLPPLQHAPHPPRPERAEYEFGCSKRLEARIAGALTGHVNTAPGTWRSSTTTAVTVEDGRIMGAFDDEDDDEC